LFCSFWDHSKKKDCHPCTGYHPFVVTKVFWKYAAAFMAAEGLSFPKSCMYYFGALIWIHMAPTKFQYGRVLDFSYQSFCRHCVPLLEHLSLVMDEVKWADRLHLHNHTANFPYFVTTAVETCYVQISEPQHGRFRSAFNSGKYHATGLKLELTCNLMGHIVDFQFPAGLGTHNDNVIFNRRLLDGTKVFEPWELCLGDGAYRGCPHCLCKFPVNFNDIWLPAPRRWVHFPLNDVQEAANEAISEIRQRIEHIVHLASTKHRMFQLAFQGTYHNLVHAVHVSVHMAALQIIESEL